MTPTSTAKQYTSQPARRTIQNRRGGGVGGTVPKPPEKYRCTEGSSGSGMVKLGSCKHGNEDANKKFDVYWTVHHLDK